MVCWGVLRYVLWSIALCVKFLNFDTFGIIRKMNILGVMNIFCGQFWGSTVKLTIFVVVLGTEWEYFWGVIKCQTFLGYA